LVLKAAKFSISRFPTLSKPWRRFCFTLYIFATFSDRRAEVGHGVFFTEQLTLYSAFLENQITIISLNGLEHLPRPPKNYESSGFRRRSACPT
jgi:hypothetical protein